MEATAAVSCCKSDEAVSAAGGTTMLGVVCARGAVCGANQPSCGDELPIWKEGAATQRFRRGSGPPEKVFNELWKPSRGRLGARRDCKVLDDHKAVDLSLQVGV